MRWLWIMLLPLAGCMVSTKPSGLPGVDEYAAATDSVMERAAASVALALEHNANAHPEKVEAELTLAQTILPRPSPQLLDEARIRSLNGDPKEYAKAMAEADLLLRELDTLWNKVEAERGLANAALASKQQELDAARQSQRDMLWSGAGLLTILLGLAALVWGAGFGVTKAEAATIMLTGLGIGSLPWLLDSELTGWVFAPLGILIGLRAVVWVWGMGWKKPKAPSINLTKGDKSNAKATHHLP